MSERHEWTEEPLGTTAEELARLMEAIGDWAKDSKDGAGAAAGGLAHALTGIAGHASDLAGRFAEDLGDHVDTGAPECTYCPVCRTVHVLRESSPEVKVHLASAAASLMQAATAVLNAAATGPGAGSGEGEDAHGDGVRAEDEAAQRTERVERIDLDGWS
ncbi:hypothetical protein FB381_3174 [Nocardioides albertanoniae]|uniref:Uncharacterized protein n=1 Tax=Nocardioides albertanoniae TaxID=1175486 RepID=A0A543A9P1_9ACTN|nr:hypothetical protein [Nocardioides albertanoniae]TQL69269.1 hypothetical protein FB381_3174 [Nocardioides albertanoniae]